MVSKKRILRSLGQMCEKNAFVGRLFFAILDGHLLILSEFYSDKIKKLEQKTTFLAKIPFILMKSNFLLSFIRIDLNP